MEVGAEERKGKEVPVEVGVDVGAITYSHYLQRLLTTIT